MLSMFMVSSGGIHPAGTLRPTDAGWGGGGRQINVRSTTPDLSAKRWALICVVSRCRPVHLIILVCCPGVLKKAANWIDVSRDDIDNPLQRWDASQHQHSVMRVRRLFSQLTRFLYKGCITHAMSVFKDSVFKSLLKNYSFICLSVDKGSYDTSHTFYTCRHFFRSHSKLISANL